MTSVIPIDEIVSVNVSRVPQGLETPNINNVAIFSHECREEFGDVKFYINIAQVAEDFGVDSITYKMANGVFSQTPNPLSTQATLAIIATSTGEPISTAVVRAQDIAYFVGFVTTQEIEASDIFEQAQAISSLDKIWMCPICDDGGIAVATQIADASLTKTRMLYYSTGYQDAQLFAAAYMGRAFSVNFAGSTTVQSMNLQFLSGIVPDPSLSYTKLHQLLDAGVDVYASFGGAQRTYTSEANRFFDQVYDALAIKLDIQYDCFNLIANTITKIPQTEAGMDSIKSVITNVMQKYVRNGFIAPGEWNSSFTFGDPAVFKNNIRQTGYYIYSLPITQQSQSDRERRIAPLIQVAVKEAGAIHHILINVTIEA